jgi:adenylate cyclase
MRTWVADSERAIDCFSRSIRLNPIDPLLGYAICGLAYAHLLKGEYDKALENARRTAHGMPTWLASWTALALAAAYVGDAEEMNRAKERILQIAPNYSIAVRRAASASGCRLFEETIERGLRMAGIPEQ